MAKKYAKATTIPGYGGVATIMLFFIKLRGFDSAQYQFGHFLMPSTWPVLFS